LLGEQPIPPPPQVDPMTGMEMPPDPMAPLSPSRMPDSVILEPGMALPIAKEWLLSEEGRMQQELNPEGWSNVKYWVQALMDMMMPPPGMEPGGPPPPEEGPPPMEERLPEPGPMGAPHPPGPPG